MPCPNLAMVGCYGSVIVLYRIVFATSILWNLYALELLCFASSLLPAPSHCEFVTFVSKVRVPIKYLSAEASIMYAIYIQLPKSHMQYSQYSPVHSREAGSGLQVMLVHTALICVLGTNPGLQL